MLDRIEHSAWRIAKKRVNGEQSQGQGMIGLPFTVYCLPDALRSALSTLRQKGTAEQGFSRLDSLFRLFTLDGIGVYHQ
ncbi:MAG: hypothetical protein PVI73_16705, partial [Syntrophobacterales bacterium]